MFNNMSEPPPPCLFQSDFFFKKNPPDKRRSLVGNFSRPRDLGSIGKKMSKTTNNWGGSRLGLLIDGMAKNNPIHEKEDL